MRRQEVMDRVARKKAIQLVFKIEKVFHHSGSLEAAFITILKEQSDVSEIYQRGSGFIFQPGCNQRTFQLLPVVCSFLCPNNGVSSLSEFGCSLKVACLKEALCFVCVQGDKQ